MNADELADFYRMIGAAIWHIQYFEDVLTSFLSAKLIKEQQNAGQVIPEKNAHALLAKNRRITLGPLIKLCAEKGIIRPEHQKQFEVFKENRHWLVHRSMVEIGDGLYSESDREAVFKRIDIIRNEAISLKKLVVGDFDIWLTTHGVDVTAAQQQAEAAVRKLERSST
jgi:hypothetical protein